MRETPLPASRYTGTSLITVGTDVGALKSAQTISTSVSTESQDVALSGGLTSILGVSVT